jgi:NAD(P)-dependent dehydrogenase (short-subunit alcohol dehydrogenase family)
MYYSSYQKKNEESSSLSASDRAVVAGGSQGIGAGIALRYALAGASVWVIGRSEERGQEIVKKLHSASQEGQRRRGADLKGDEIDHAFFQADLSDVKEIKRVAEEVNKRAGKAGVGWLIETQGGPPTGNAGDTPAGIDSAFAVQCLSRYGLAKSLLERGTVKNGVCFIAVPGQGGKSPLDLNDIELRSKRSRFGLNIPRSGARDSAVLDAVTQTLAERYPSVHFTHVFPGIVATNAAANQGFPFPIPQLYKALSLIVPSPAQFAELPFYLHTHPEARAQYLQAGQANLFMPWLSRTALSTNVQDKSHRDAIIAKLDSYGV